MTVTISTPQTMRQISSRTILQAADCAAGKLSPEQANTKVSTVLTFNANQ